MFPKLISIGGVFLPTYGVLVALGFLLGLWVTTKLGRKSGVPSDDISNLAIYCAIAGMIGAKLGMFAFEAWSGQFSFSEVFTLETLRAAGVYQGGLILALIVAVLYLRHRKLPFLGVADLFAPGVALGHAIGRLGCFAAGCCWGIDCDRPWAVTFHSPDAHELTGVPLNRPLHPTQLYESITEFLIFAYLYRAAGKPHREGSLIGQYLTLSSAGRFLIEFFRNHEQSLPLGLPFSLTQWISIALFLIGLLLILRTKPAMVAPARP
jgi:phosphatidylglycerol:prolipoprotein diacylglycerol transferase